MRNDSRIKRAEIFRDTLEWINTDEKLSESVETAKARTEIYSEDCYPYFPADVIYDTEITVTGDRSCQAAMRLKNEMPDSRIAVMNFANAFHPGGGVEWGASAQEESLCRTTTLYPVLKSAVPFYTYHIEKDSYKASDALIYSENIIICKTDSLLPERMPPEEHIAVDVITIAAPDLREDDMSSPELFGCHVKRVMHMLTAAAAKKADVLVIGAFGCDAFGNDPYVVARAFRAALNEFPKVFRKIEFAVYCSEYDRTNFKVFSDILGSPQLGI